MKKTLLRVSLVFVVASLLVGGTALAQQAQSEPDRYVVVTYLKTLPGQEEAYRGYLTTTGKKIYQELLNANSNFLYWSVAKAMYQGEGGGSYDYVGAAVFSGPPPDPNTNNDAVFQKVVGTTQAEFGKKLATMRTVVGNEILMNRAIATVPGTLKEGDYRVVAQVSVKPGMGDEYYDAMKTTAQPAWQSRIADGDVKGWSVWQRVFPAGAAASYDALSVTYFKDLASAIKGPNARKGAETFMKVNPGKNYATWVSNLRDYSELQQRTIMQVIALVERSAPTASK